jgi:predicted regulator of Ras-like GTPase activity (Roadblock/LC7/MglB family)
MFREVLARAGSELSGCLGAAVVGIDGVLVEQWTAQESATMEPLAAEFTTVIKAARAALANMEGSALTELTLRTVNWTGVVRTIGVDYFLILLTTPDELVGRSRFVVQRAAPLLEREIA